MKMIRNTPNFNYNGNLKSSIRKIINGLNSSTRNNMVPVAGPPNAANNSNAENNSNAANGFKTINNPAFNAPPTINTLRNIQRQLNNRPRVPREELLKMRMKLGRIRHFINTKHSPKNRNNAWEKMNATHTALQRRVNRALRGKP